MLSRKYIGRILRYYYVNVLLILFWLFFVACSVSADMARQRGSWIPTNNGELLQQVLQAGLACPQNYGYWAQAKRITFTSFCSIVVFVYDIYDIYSSVCSSPVPSIPRTLMCSEKLTVLRVDTQPCAPSITRQCMTTGVRKILSLLVLNHTGVQCSK